MRFIQEHAAGGSLHVELGIWTAYALPTAFEGKLILSVKGRKDK